MAVSETRQAAKERPTAGRVPGPGRGAGAAARPGLAVVAAVVLALALAATPGRGEGRGKDVLAGPVPARVLRVIDGDTLTVRARIWLGQEVEVRVRIAAVDAPELKGGCARERALAREARALVEATIGAGEVVLRDIRYGKFAGRVLARVESGGEDLAGLLRAAGLARAYGGGRRGSWCETAAAAGP